MRAFEVEIDRCTLGVVLAPTPGKATSEVIREWTRWSLSAGWHEIEWRDVRRRRLPELDGETITAAQMVRSGLLVAYCECGDEIDAEHMIETEEGALACSPACLEDAKFPLWPHVSLVPGQACLLTREGC